MWEGVKDEEVLIVIGDMGFFGFVSKIFFFWGFIMIMDVLIVRLFIG